MKIILGGATGTAGGQALKYCLNENRITRVVVLSRMSLTDEITNNAKVEVVLHDDFSQYPASILDKLKGAEACVWAIGGRVDQFSNDREVCYKVNVTFSLAAANVMRENLAQHSPTGKIRFVFCSGEFAVWDQGKKLYFLSDTRKIKGAAERSLSDMADAYPSQFETFLLRPGGFIEPDASMAKKILGNLYHSVPTPQLGKALIKVAVDGWKDRIVENPAICCPCEMAGKGALGLLLE